MRLAYFSLFCLNHSLPPGAWGPWPVSPGATPSFCMHGSAQHPKGEFLKWVRFPILTPITFQLHPSCGSVAQQPRSWTSEVRSTFRSCDPGQATEPLWASVSSPVTCGRLQKPRGTLIVALRTSIPTEGSAVRPDRSRMHTVNTQSLRFHPEGAWAERGRGVAGRSQPHPPRPACSGPALVSFFLS
jgi:hypothetical protein